MRVKVKSWEALSKILTYYDGEFSYYNTKADFDKRNTDMESDWLGDFTDHMKHLCGKTIEVGPLSYLGKDGYHNRYQYVCKDFYWHKDWLCIEHIETPLWRLLNE